MSSNIKQFKIDLQKGVNNTVSKMTFIIKKVSIDIIKSVIKMSPVDTGRFRGNWQVGKNSAVTTVLETLDKTGANTLAIGIGEISTVKMGDSVFINNNLPYATSLENGHSNQASQGMVAVTLANVQTVFESKKL